jgi:SAM-dependent methyltransferase
VSTASSEQVEINAGIWRRGDYVEAYANRQLAPVEVVILARYRQALSRRVLDAGCGAGRVLSYLVALGGDVHGFDLSEAMVARCRRAYPTATVMVGDLAAIGEAASGPFDAIIVADNVIDVFDDADRRRILTDIRGLLAPDGLLMFSSHNLEYMDGPVTSERPGGAASPPGGAASPRGGRWRRMTRLLSQLAARPISDFPGLARRLPRRIRNRRRLAKLERRADDHAILNDEAHDYSLLHYYIRSEDQARQLVQLGYELIECLDAEGWRVAPGQGSPSPWLYYIARPSPMPSTG